MSPVGHHQRRDHGAGRGAYRASAHYRDIALGLAPGTSELQRGTAKSGAAGCVSATG